MLYLVLFFFVIFTFQLNSREVLPFVTFRKSRGHRRQKRVYVFVKKCHLVYKNVICCKKMSFLHTELLRPFLIQSDLSVENGRFRLKPKWGFLTQSKKGFFDSPFFD